MRSVASSAVVYVLLTATIGIDVIRHIGTHVASDPGDPLLTAAILTWNAEHRVLSEAWWQFPIFYPSADVLAFSEHLLGVSVIATPISWLTGNGLVAYNLTLLLTYPLCGLAMYALVFRLTRSAGAAFLAGLAYTLAPFRAAQLSHIQLLATFYTPLVLLGLHAFLETGRRRWLVLLGTAWLLQALVSGYLLIYGAVLVAAWLAWFVIAPGRWRELRALVVTLVVASLPLAPILLRYANVHAREGFSRGLAEAALFAADLTALLCAPPRLTFWGWLQIGCKPESEIFPGLALVTLCAAGALWHWRSGRQPIPAAPSGLRTVEPSRSREPGVRSPAWEAALSRPVFVRIRRALLAISALFIFIGIVTAVLGGWQIDLGWMRATSATAVKPVSLAIGLLMLAGLTLPRVWSTARQSSVPLFYLLAALATWVLAWGPAPELLGTQVIYQAPFAWLMQLPGGNSVRVPARFWLLTVLCLVVLMGYLVGEVLRHRKSAAMAIVLAAAFGLVVDGWLWIPATPVPPHAPRPDLLRGGVVLELPAGETLGDIAAVYRAVTGGWRTVNGFSGYEPASYQQLRDDSLAGRVDLEPFLAQGTLHVLVSGKSPALNEAVAAHPGSEFIGQSGGMTQYRIAAR